MLYVTTPCSRPQNLEIISKSIPEECFWAVIYDDTVDIPKNIKKANYFKCNTNGFVGAEARNHFINTFPLNDNDWLYSLDDDNIIHEDFYKTIKHLLKEDYSIIHWGQLNKDKTERLKPQIRLQRIDAACFISKWKFNKNIKYNTEKYEYDGIYVIDCAKNGPVLTINKNLCYYNYLR